MAQAAGRAVLIRKRGGTQAGVTLPQLLGLAVLYTVWGSTYAAMKVLGEWLPVFLAQGSRFLAGGLGLLVFCACTRGLGAIRATLGELANAAAVGFLLLVGSGAVLIYAERTAPSSLAALLSSTVPLWSLIIICLSRRSLPPLANCLAICLGFAGVAVLAWPGSLSHEGQLGAAPLMLIGASLSAALGAYVGGRASLPPTAVLAAAYEMLAAGLLVVTLGLATGEGQNVRLARVPWTGWFAFGYLIFAGSMLALAVFAWLITELPITTVATYSYVNPVVAVIIGTALLHDRLSATFFAGGAVIVAATVVVISTGSGGWKERRPPLGTDRNAAHRLITKSYRDVHAQPKPGRSTG